MLTHKHASQVKSLLIAFILTSDFVTDDVSIFNCQESPQTIRLSICHKHVRETAWLFCYCFNYGTS